MARLDRVATVKEIAQIGAVIGREFSYPMLRAVCLIEKTMLDQGLQRLVESGLAFRRGSGEDSVYLFKHALVQDAAYDSLLKSKRQELHARIASFIEESYPGRLETEPELLAQHYTQAALLNKAIPHWHRAGNVALKRRALTEAITHLNKGLELVATLPASTELDAAELDLRTVLGTAWMALKGWAANEVWNTFYPALPLARSLKRNDALLHVLWGLCVNVVTQGKVAASFDWVRAMLSTAAENGDSDSQVVAHVAAMNSYYYLGDLAKSREHAEHMLAIYSEERHARLTNVLNHDPKTLAGIFRANWTWMLGFPDDALVLSDAKDERARHGNHIFDLGFALTVGAEVFDYRCEPEALSRRANEAERLGKEHGMPFLWSVLAPSAQATALIRAGQWAEGVRLMQSALDMRLKSGVRNRVPYFKAVLAEGVANLGDTDRALVLIDECIAQCETPGCEDRIHYAEILRLKGWILSLGMDHAGAETLYQASLHWARTQGAKSWELRTATSLAGLWLARGQRTLAVELLAPIYHWFTQGFDTKDLKDARALLGQLA